MIYKIGKYLYIMKDELLKTLIKELFLADTLQQEYCDNDIHYVIDSNKEGNTITIKVTLEEDSKDKKEFEKWLESVDDDLFSEVLDELEDEISDLQNIYQSPNYKQTIDKVKAKTKEVAARKIKELQKLI